MKRPWYHRPARVIPLAFLGAGVSVAMGATDVVDLLQANLDQEVHTSEELEGMLQKIVAG